MVQFCTITANLKCYNKYINKGKSYFFLDNKKIGCSNKILVVCNTIKEAQKIYEELRKYKDIDNENLNILHSRFIRKERLAKEEQIIEFGKTYDEEGNIDSQDGIWISTPLVLQHANLSEDP